MTHPDTSGQGTEPARRPETMLEVAQNAAQRGWSVFPLVPGAKVPAIEQWPERATTETDRIGRYWSHPACARHGVGIACGPSGLLVIDLDQPKPGAAGMQRPTEWRRAGICDGADVLADLCEQAGEPFPFDTHTVRTPRGGLHLYFTQPPGLELRSTQGSTAAGLGWLIDTRGHGGYVVAAGCVVGGRRYDTIHDADPAPLPTWLADRLTPDGPGERTPSRPVEPVQLATVGSGEGRSAYLDAAIRAEVAHVTGAPSGQHNRALFIAAQNLGQLVASGALAEADVYAVLLDAERTLAATCNEPHTERQAHATIASGLRAGGKRPRRLQSPRDSRDSREVAA